MKKNKSYCSEASDYQDVFTKVSRFNSTTLLAMKLSIILTLFVTLNSFAISFGQSISLNVKNEKLENVLKEIQKQSGYSHLANTDHFEKSKLVSLNVRNMAFTDVLNRIFKDQPFDYLISDKIITVIPKRNQIAEPKVQQTIITGQVTDDAGKPLSGVTVMEVNTKNAVITDNKGGFTLKLSKEEARISFRLIGYLEKTLNSSVNMQVKLVAVDEDIDEVIITGFQKIKKEKFTGSVSTVDKAVIDRSGYVDVSKMLQGAAAGVSVQNVSGTLGTSAKIRIRGNSSISANQEPLYVVNGVPITSPSGVSVNQLYSGDVAAVLGSSIAGLNAQDIEDIVILKDGSATALYGTRAANGVISITTKSGKVNQNRINYSTGLSYGLKPNIKNYNLMNSQEEMALNRRLWNAGYFSDEVWPSQTGPYTEPYRKYGLREIDLEESYAELKKATNINTDWFDVLFRNNLLQEHNLSFSGGNEKNTYYLSGNFTNDNGQAIGFNVNRYTVNFRDNLKINDRLSLDFTADFSNRNQRTPGTLNSFSSFGATARSFEINPTLYALKTSRAMYAYNDDGSPKHYINNLAPFNIVEELNENFADIKTQEMRFIVRPTFKITKEFTYEFQGALSLRNNIYNHTATERSNYAESHRVDYNEALRDKNGLLWRNPNDPNAVKESILPVGGMLFARSNTGKYYNIRNHLTFNKFWTNFTVNSLVGMQIESDYYDRTYNKNYGYLYYSGKTTNPSALAYLKAVHDDDKLFITSFTQENRVGFYTNNQLSFFDRYNLEVGLRFDGSNVFGRSVRSKFLPVYNFGFSWNIEKEKFFKNIDPNANFDYIKLRGSYALRGLTFQTSPMMNALPVNLNKIDLQNSSTGIQISSPELYSLNWEKDQITNLGLDISLLKRFNLTVELYTRRNSNLINDFFTSLEEGFTQKKVNWATMSNKGVDVSLAFNNILNKENFKWDVSLIYGYVKNTIVDGSLQSVNLTVLTNPQGSKTVGYPQESLFAYRFAGLNNMGRPTFYKGDEVITNIGSSERDESLIEFAGSRMPTSTGSLATNFGYKGFDLRFFFTFAAGHKVFKEQIASRFYYDANSKSADLNSMWQTPGNEEITNIPGLISGTQQTYLITFSNIDELAYNRSTERVVDASHIRLSEIMLSYNLKNVLMPYSFIKNARISLAANNLNFWGSHRLRGVDPDVFITGVNLPNPRSYSLRLALGF